MGNAEPQALPQTYKPDSGMPRNLCFDSVPWCHCPYSTNYPLYVEFSFICTFLDYIILFHSIGYN